jgi:hypothetical protein
MEENAATDRPFTYANSSSDYSHYCSDKKQINTQRYDSGLSYLHTVMEVSKTLRQMFVKYLYKSRQNKKTHTK